jgi:putative lipoic acid-binding regulatory protein
MSQGDNEILLEFPCDFSIKAMGLANNEFELLVVDIVRRHTKELRENAVCSRPSKNGKYCSITITIQATSKKQLDTIYQELHDTGKVLMAL